MLGVRFRVWVSAYLANRVLVRLSRVYDPGELRASRIQGWRTKVPEQPLDHLI